MKPSELIAEPGSWCQNHMALKADGIEATSPQSADACRWCIMGAFKRCYGSFVQYGQAVHKMRSMKLISDATSLTDWNDSLGRTRAEVIQLLKTVGE